MYGIVHLNSIQLLVILLWTYPHDHLDILDSLLQVHSSGHVLLDLLSLDHLCSYSLLHHDTLQQDHSHLCYALHVLCDFTND